MDKKLQWFYFNKGMGQPGGGASSSLLTGLQVYYPLTEASGTRADSVGSVDLTDSGSVGSGDGPGGDLGTAAQFDGTNELTSTDAVHQVGDADFTIACWMYFGDLNTQFVLGKTGGTASEYYIRVVAGVLWAMYAGGAVTTATTNPGLSATTWYPVRFWFDSAGDEIGVQIDGNAAATAAFTGTPNTSDSTFQLGAVSFGNFRSGGRLAGYAKWSRLLTDDEWDTFRATPPVGYPF